MNKNKIRLLALDLDGTTLTSGNTLSDTIKSAIESAIAKHIKIVVASGRPFGTMPQEILNIKGIDYIAASNGARIYDCNNNCVRHLLLNPDEVVKLLKITEPYDLIFEAFIDSLTYTDIKYSQNPAKYGCSEAYFDYVRSAHGHMDNMREFIYEHRFELDSIEIIEPDFKILQILTDKIKSKNLDFYITSSVKGTLEFMSIEATKANAVEWICGKLGINQNEVSACGNADNDADMIHWAGLGAAVENSSELCKANADIIVPSNDRNGVAELIRIITEE